MPKLSTPNDHVKHEGLVEFIYDFFFFGIRLCLLFVLMGKNLNII